MTDFVDFLLTLKSIEKPNVFYVFGSKGMAPASFMGGPALLRPAVLIKGVSGALCGRLAVAQAVFIDLEPSSAPCGSLGSILLGTLASPRELLGVLRES